MTEEPLTPEEQIQFERYINLLGSAPTQEEKVGIFQFFNKILLEKDTTKVSNLDKQELFSVRTYIDTAKYCNVMGLKKVGEYLMGNAETILASSLGKQGFLITSAITQKKELKSGLSKKEKSKWFEKKEAQT